MDEVKILRCGDLVISGKRVGSYFWFFGWSVALVVNEVLNLLTQVVVLVGSVIVLLVECIVF